MSAEWSDNVDLNDGKMQQMYMAYRKHLDFINIINGKEEDIQLLRQQDVDLITSSKLSQLFLHNIHCIHGHIALKKFNDE